MIGDLVDPEGGYEGRRVDGSDETVFVGCDRRVDGRDEIVVGYVGG